MGRNKKKYSCFFFGGGGTGPDGTTAFRGEGGILKFYGASAVNENRVMAVKGGATKRYFECTREVGTQQAEQALSAPPPPPHTPLFRDGPHGTIHKQQPAAAA